MSVAPTPAVNTPSPFGGVPPEEGPNLVTSLVVATEPIQETRSDEGTVEQAIEEEVRNPDLSDALLTVLVVLAVFYTIYFTRAVLFPITLAVILNLVFKPVVLWLQRLRIPPVVSAGAILVFFVAMSTVGTWLVWEPASQRLAEIRSPDYLNRLAKNLKPLQKPLADLEHASDVVEKITNGKTAPLRVQVEQPQLGAMLTLTGGFIGSAAIMLVLLFFLLAAGDRFLEKLVVLMPTFRDKRRIVELSREVQHRMSDYLFTITLINGFVGVAIGVGMWSIGLPNPILWGVMGALLNYIPFAGAAIGAFIVFWEGLAQFNSLSHAALAPAIYVGINIVEANFVTPTLVGKSISLNPVMIVLATVFWGWLWGVGGVLLAVPMLVVLKIFFDQSKILAPLGLFLEK